MSTTPGIDRILFRLFCLLFLLLPVSTSPAVIAGGLALALWIFSGRAFSRRERYLGQRWFLPVLCMLLLPLAGLIYSIDPASGLKVSEKSYYWLFAFAIASLDMGPGQVRRLLDLFLAGLLLTAGVSLMQRLGMVPLHRGGTATGFMNHITYSLFFVFGILLLSFYFREAEGKPKRRRAIAALMLVFAIAVALSPAKIGYIALFLLSPVALVNLFGRRKALAAVLGAAAVCSALLLSPVVRERADLAVREYRYYREVGVVGSSTGLRLHMWKGAALIFLENPVLGVGTGGYMKAMKRFETFQEVGDLGHPHSSYLYMLATFGTVGILAFLWYLRALLMKGWQARRSAEGASVLYFCLVLMIGSLTDTQTLAYASGVMAALMTGLPMGGEA